MQRAMEAQVYVTLERLLARHSKWILIVPVFFFRILYMNTL